MNKKILLSLLTIVAVIGVVFGTTQAYFSDKETRTGNVLGAGVIDIVVNETNPWETHSAPFVLEDMKPSYTKYIEFTVRNLVESNPINLWKHIDITEQSDNIITEPECEEGGGTWDDSVTPCLEAEQCCTGDYEPRNNVAAYTLYDMYVCASPSEGGCETDENGKPEHIESWRAIITEDQYVRLDNVDSIWTALGQLDPGDELKVVQSYHLSSWPDAPEPEVTNWAQGDKITFDIELMATQLNAPGPEGVMGVSNMDNKDPVTWDPVTDDDMEGMLTYNKSGETFNYSFTGDGLQASTSYSLIYYADPYPGNHPGALIDTMTTDGSGHVAKSNNIELGMDLPTSPDSNSPGAKVWLVPSSRYNSTTKSIIGWNPTEYLFEINLISYVDTGI